MTWEKGPGSFFQGRGLYVSNLVLLGWRREVQGVRGGVGFLLPLSKLAKSTSKVKFYSEIYILIMKI